jgi:hypothetical protein
MKKEIIIPILNDEYKVIFTWGNPSEISKVLKAWGHQESSTLGGVEDRRGACFYSKECHPVIAMPRKPKTPTEIGTLSHEAVHAIGHIFQAISEKYLDTEVFAHSVGAVVRGVLK